MTRGVELLRLFDAWAQTSRGGIRGRLCVGVFAGTGFLYWTVAPGPDGRPATKSSAELDAGADATLLLTSSEVEALLAGRQLARAEHMRFRGDVKVLRSFADQIVRQGNAISIRTSDAGV